MTTRTKEERKRLEKTKEEVARIVRRHSQDSPMEIHRKVLRLYRFLEAQLDKELE